MAGATFEMIQCLGRGSFGEVYLSKMTEGGLSRRVAVKVLKLDIEDEPQAVRRMRDEARILAALDHPAILSVYRLTRLQGRVALVTEYVDGVDLSRCGSESSLMPERAALGILGEVAGALDCAWNTTSPDSGRPIHLVHRDIKPANIRLSKHGEVKLLDFGIARAQDMAREAQTAAGDTPFTMGYAPPEVFTKGEQGPEGDVFAWGVTLYRLLCAKRFFDKVPVREQIRLAGRQGAFDQRTEDKLLAVEHAHPEVRRLLQRALAWDPAARPTARELQEVCMRLDEVLEGPTYVRWARSVVFPPARDLDGGSLTGQVVKEGDAHRTHTFRLPSPEELRAEEAERTTKRLPRQLRKPSLPTRIYPEARRKSHVATVIRPPPADRKRRRWWPAVLVALLIMALIVGLALTGAGLLAGVWFSL